MLKVAGKKKIDRSDIKRILIRATNWVGDAVMTLPALEAVHRNFPESSITILAKPWVLPIFESHPCVNHVMSLQKQDGYGRRVSDLIWVTGEIRRRRFDLAVLFQNAFEAALLARMGGVPLRLGFNTDGRGFLLTHRVVRDRAVLAVHQVVYYLSLLRAMGWEAPERDPCLHLNPKTLNKAQELFSSRGIQSGDVIIGLSPGAIFGDAKRWPAKRFAAIGDWAVERWGAKVLVLGSQGEREICRTLTDAMTHRPLNLCGRTSLKTAMALIGSCQCFVTNDSGLMHIASALGVPTVAIFGSTDPVATGPRGPKTRVVKHDVACAPCLRHECPTDFQCMLTIQAEEVWEEMENLKGAGLF